MQLRDWGFQSDCSIDRLRPVNCAARQAGCSLAVLVGTMTSACCNRATLARVCAPHEACPCPTIVMLVNFLGKHGGPQVSIENNRHGRQCQVRELLDDLPAPEELLHCRSALIKRHVLLSLLALLLLFFAAHFLT